jgi:hypothetical protein
MAGTILIWYMHVHVFTNNAAAITDTIDQANQVDPSAMTVNLHNLPSSGSDNAKYNLFAECASIQLYLTELFDNDAMPERVIYMDIDTLVTAPLSKLWAQADQWIHQSSTFLIALGEAVGEGSSVKSLYTGRQYKDKVPLYRGTVQGLKWQDVAAIPRGNAGLEQRCHGNGIVPHETSHFYNTGIRYTIVCQTTQDCIALWGSMFAEFDDCAPTQHMAEITMPLEYACGHSSIMRRALFEGGRYSPWK